MRNWDPEFAERSSMLEPYSDRAADLRACARWPTRAALNALLEAAGVCNTLGMPLRARPPESGGALSYEMRVHQRGELAVRESDWHDLFNVLVWCTFPATKAALNARHVRAAQMESSGTHRGMARDALTLFDENGAIVISSEPDLIDDLRAFRWKRLFWTERERVRATLRVYLFGHALLEKALAPYVGMTAHAITLRVPSEVVSQPGPNRLARIDALAARHIVEAIASPHDLAPLPLLGVPGWWKANAEERFYEDTGYFRPRRRRS